MTENQENKFSMFLTTEKVVVDYTAVWTPVTAFGTGFSSFRGKIVEIKNLSVKQEVDLKGIAENKTNKKSTLINSTLSIAKPMVAYSNVTNNPQLRQEVDYSESDLKKNRDTNLETICTIIFERATTNAAALVPYGVTAPMIAGLGTAITNYHNILSGPRLAIAVRKHYTSEIGIIMKEASNILTGQLDQLAILFETSSPEFFNSYKNARIIVDLGGSIKTYSGKVPGNTKKNILNTAGNETELFELNNTGTVELYFGRGSDSNDMGLNVRVNLGEILEKTASELGVSGNKYLNVNNESPEEGSYKVVRM